MANDSSLDICLAAGYIATICNLSLVCRMAPELHRVLYCIVLTHKRTMPQWPRMWSARQHCVLRQQKGSGPLGCVAWQLFFGLHVQVPAVP
jgi:hypothetical protein